MTNCTTCLLRLSTIWLCTSAAFANPAPTTESKNYLGLIQGDHEFPNTCAPREKLALHAALVKTKVPDPEQAWRLVDTLLCAEKTQENQRMIRNAMAAKVKATYEGTGQDPGFKALKSSDKTAEQLMAGGAAWQATLKGDSDALVLQYWSDSVSVSGTTIAYKKTKWLITEHGSARD